MHDVIVESRELTVTLEGGIPQALRVAEATSAGPVLAGLSAAEQESVRDRIRQGLQAYLRGEAVCLPTGANIALATA